MFTDPNHLRVEDPGQVEGNPVFIYLDPIRTRREHLARDPAAVMEILRIDPPRRA